MTPFPSLSKTRQNRAGDAFAAGFTLVEVLVAVLIFSVITAAVLGSFHMVFSHTRALVAETKVTRAAAICLDRMILDLKSVYVSLPPEYPPPAKNNPPDPFSLTGGPDPAAFDRFSRLAFSGWCHLPVRQTPDDPVMDPGALARITYHVRQRPDGGADLVREDRPYPVAAPEKQAPDTAPVLCPDVTEFKVRFVDAKGRARESWDSDSPDFSRAFPRGVEISLSISREDRVYPFMTRVDLEVFRP